MANINQFVLSRFYYCYLTQNILKKSNKKILDLGCGDGSCIAKMNTISTNLFGYDVDSDKIKSAKKLHPHIVFKSGRPGKELPYDDNSFDVIFLFHVLEHVDSEEKIVGEIYRILKPGGTLMLASPYRGLFAWADTANLRYYFPFLHKILAPIYYGKEKYIDLFQSNAKKMYGDSTLGRVGHKHYKKFEVVDLLSGKFLISDFITYSLFQPILLIIDNILIMIFKKRLRFMDWLVWLDNKIDAGEFSNNMLVVAKKYGKKK